MTPYILSLVLKSYKYMLRKLKVSGAWDLYYVSTYYHHHNPVTVPGPQCCDHLLGGGALYTVHTVQCTECTVVSSLCCAG